MTMDLDKEIRKPLPQGEPMLHYHFAVFDPESDNIGLLSLKGETVEDEGDTPDSAPKNPAG